MKKICIILLAALTAAGFLTGCRETPGKGVVVQKDMEQMIQKAMSAQQKQGSLPEVLGVAQNRYETHFQDESGKIKVTVDADVVLPEAGSIPIVRVKSMPFGQDTVNKLVEILFEDGALYDPESLSELTKTDIVELLAQLKQKKAELEAQGMKPEQSENGEIEAEVSDNVGSSNEEVAMSSNGNRLDQVIETIRLMEQNLKTAPDEKKYVEATDVLKPQDISGMSQEDQEEYRGKLFEIAHIGQLNQEGGMRSLFVVNNEKTIGYHVQYINRKDYDMTTGSYYSEDRWREMSDGSNQAAADELAYPAMTMEQAKAVADQFLGQIGIDYLECAFAEKVIGGSSSEYAGGIKTGNILKAYRLQYVRKMQGVPLTYTNVESAWEDTDTSSVWVWDYEKMTFIIDDSGIVEIEWDAPYQIKETLTENTNMLSFSEIQDVFRKMSIINNAEYLETGAELDISEVRLGLARITEQNQLSSGLLVPVWDFFGTLTTYYEEDGVLKPYTRKEAGESFLTVNAIDGSVIDRKLGH
jgi:hypothetical protein